MLTLTEAAGSHLAHVLADKECPEDMAVRLVCANAGHSLVLDNRKAGDSTIEYGGRMILLLDATAVKLLDSETLDVEQTDDGAKLFFVAGDAGSA